MINHDWIAAHIPHRGTMCLLEAVELWDETRISCRAVSHRHNDNPLRAGNRLGIANAIEYAAQAMAVHGALLAGDQAPPGAGFLTSVRDVRWQQQRLDDVAAPLSIHATRLSGNEVTVLYHFEIHAAGNLLVSGRASAILDASAVAA